MSTLINSELATRAAIAHVATLTDSRLRMAFHLAEAKVAYLVQRLDRQDSWYYVVTFGAGDRETARILIDAFDGTLGEATGISKEGDSLKRYMSAPDALTRLLAKTEHGSDWLPFRVRGGTVGEHPVLVWKPCGQSSSPFLPFYQLSVGDSFVYYRVDGEMFDALTEGPA
jgi:hypothetical protein